MVTGMSSVKNLSERFLGDDHELSDDFHNYHNNTANFSLKLFPLTYIIDLSFVMTEINVINKIIQ